MKEKSCFLRAGDLSEIGEVVYRDKGYHGVRPRGWDATMKRGRRGHSLSIWDRFR